jgi:hypothetical protein
MAATASAAKLGPFEGNDLDASFAQQCVGINIAVIGNDDPGFEGQNIVAIIPLLALGLI